MAAKDSVELRVLHSGQFVTERGVTLLKGMRCKASPVEAFFLQRCGVCERTDGGPVVPRETRERSAVCSERPVVLTRR